MSFQKFLRQQFRCCLHCSSWSCGDSLFCTICEIELWKEHQEIEAFEVSSINSRAFALFSWFPDQDRKLSKLLLAIKGGQLTETFDFYAKNFLQRLPEDYLPTKTVLVPCPSTTIERRHSHELARAFSEILQFPVIDCLTKTDSQGSQNSMSSNQCLKDKYVIFIDDIVTSGGTVISAQKAIGPCLGFSTWCLAHRRQLAAEGLF